MDFHVYLGSTHADQVTDSVLQALVNLLHEQLCGLFATASGETEWKASVDPPPKGKREGKGTPDGKDQKAGTSGPQPGTSP